MTFKIARKLTDFAARRIFRPKIEVEPSGNLLRLGSPYGGWTIEDAAYLNNCLAISCGLGEDASFDVEFATKYAAELIIVDPTPRAIAHHSAIIARLGTRSGKRYIAGGSQPIEAYDVSGLSGRQLRIIPKAIWVDEKPIRFYKPTDPRHVSHSIKFRPDSADDEPYIVVPTVTLESLLIGEKRQFALLKMDIEGAETDVLKSIGSWRELPRQILVEFDVLRRPGSASAEEVESVDKLLRTFGYLCRHCDGDRNYLYVR